LELGIPGRDRRVKGDAYTGTAGGGVGLVTRVENMVKDTGNYRTECAQRHDHAQNRIAELEKVADAPFSQADELRDKRHQLETITAQLNLDANSPEAREREQQARERLAEQGRKPGWSLALNPTPALLADRGQQALDLHAGRGFVAPPAEPGRSHGDAAHEGEGHATTTAVQERPASQTGPEQPLTDAERRVQEVMARRRTKTIRQIVDHAANGGTPPAPNQERGAARGKNGPRYGR